MKLKSKLGKLARAATLALSIYACGDIKSNDDINEYTNSDAITITSKPSSLDIMVKDNWEYDFNVVPDNNMTYSLKNNPPNMTIDDNSGLVELISEYKDLGKYWITITAKGDGLLAQQAFPFEVKYDYNLFGTPLSYDFIKGSLDNEKIVVCETPCSFTQNYFDQKAQGIFLGSDALENLIQTTPANNNFPIEIHLETDSRCTGSIGGSATYYGWQPSLICLYDGPSGLDPSSIEDQNLSIHEETHLYFKERARFSGEEEIVSAMSNILTDLKGTMPNLDSFCDNRLQNFGTEFVYDLCINYGFDVGDLLSFFFQELISRSQVKGSILNTAEVRDVLNYITGYDTTQAFIDNNLNLNY